MIALLALVLATAEPATLNWLAGYWLSCENGRQTAEVWINDGKGVLVGVNQSDRSFEFMKIAPLADGAHVFSALPGGAQATDFSSVELGRRRAVFANPGHDFPQRVIYERKGGLLIGRIEGETGSGLQTMEWRFRRARLGDRCPGR